MRTSPIRTAALAAATVALALTLTACGGSDSATGGGAQTDVRGDAGGPKGSEKTVGTGGRTPTAPEAGPDTNTVTGSDEVTAVGSADARPCSGDEMAYSVLHRFPGQQGEHLLITARNAGSEPCSVTSYPCVMLAGASNVVRHSAKDAPGSGAPLTVEPGDTVYSAVNLFADSAKTHTSGTFSLALRDRTGDSGPGAEQNAFDSEGAPSKFTWSDADVLNWNTAKPYNF
ncbi:MAG TPA: DUF4232 domain-containing protein [Streptomyces sp.]|nr:DUF4232 domain-containing protein [Streptomyces sp.]